MVSCYEVVCDTKNRDAWLEARRTGIGASEIAAVLGENPYSSALCVYAEKVKAANVANDNVDENDVEEERSEAFDEEDEQSEAAEWGLRLEPLLIQVFRERTGRPVQQGKQLLRSVDHPWALSTIDAWTGDGQSTWPLQIKTTTAFLEDRWVDGPPEYYRIQQHQEMLVTGKMRHSIACLIGGQKFIWCDTERDESLIERIRRCGEEFWQLVQARVMPEPDGSEATREAIRRLYPQENGEIVRLDETFVELTNEICGLKERRRELNARLEKLKAEIDARENRIRVAMGSALVAQLPDYSTWTWKTQRRRAYTVDETSYRTLKYAPPKPLMRRTKRAVGE